MRIILVEFPWQLKDIINKQESFKKDVIVSLDPESSYILKTNKIPYFETYQFCNHKELWLKYKELTNRSIKIAEILDEALWYTDKRFKDLNWKLFNDYHYFLKICFDQLFYYSELISKLIEKFNPSEIVMADTKKILINDNFLICSNISIIKYLFEASEGSFNKIKISYVLPNQNKKIIFSFYNNFIKFIFSDIKNVVKKIIINNYYKINFVINYYTSKPKYLSIDCLEILQYKKLYPNESKFFLFYYCNNINKKKFINNLIFYNKLMGYLKNETNFYELIKHKNISFRLIFNQILFKLTQELDFLFCEYDKAKKILNRTKPKCVIFNSMSPYYTHTLAFRKNCFDLNIPFATWIHGGFGLTYSLASIDVTDFRLCNNFISFGDYFNDLINSESSIIKKLGFHNNKKIFPVGSPKFDYYNRNQYLNKILKPNNKKTILFMAGALISKNNFYFGRNREKFETSLWELHYDILNLLKKYQNKYNIIFKDYPEGHKSLWKKVLIDINADKFLYVSNEHKVNDLLKISDLNVLPWTSTTFFEALYFDADIFVIEEDINEKLFEGRLRGEIFYFKNAEKFLLELDKYLEAGNFYTTTKKNSKNYFLKFDGLNKRDQLLNETLSKIINKN